MVAALYDESLDAFAGHNWMTRFNIFRHDYSRMHTAFANQPRNFSNSSTAGAGATIMSRSPTDHSRRTSP